MANNQELKAAKNTVNIAGVVKEYKLEKASTDKGDVIKGSLIVKAGEFREIKVNVYVNKMTKRDTSKITENYKVLESFINKDLLTLAEVDSEEEATKVRIYGNDNFAPQFRENVFPSKNNDDEYEAKTSIGVSLGYGHIKVDNTLKEEEYHADFDLVIYVTKDPEEEIKDNKKTDRCVLQGVVPCYDGTAFPVTLIAGILPPTEDDPEEYDFAGDVLSYVSKGQTLNVWGEINFLHLIETIKKGGRMGRAKIETVESYVNEFVIIGADEESVDNSYTEEQIKVALEEREISIQNVISNAEKGNDKGNNKIRQRGMSRIDKRALRGENKENTSETTDSDTTETQKQTPRRRSF